MKIAGTRNAGAWYRFNNYLNDTNRNNNDKTQLQALILALDSIAAYMSALGDIAAKTGVSLPAGLLTAGAFATTLTSQGIPLQVWMGKLTFDTYTRTGASPNYKYKPDHAKVAATFGSDLRKVCTNWKFADAELIDVENLNTIKQGNRGGVANAKKGD